MKFTRKYISQELKAGLVIGFITKSDTERKLQNCPVGTFLLRFSDSASGMNSLVHEHLLIIQFFYYYSFSTVFELFIDFL